MTTDYCANVLQEFMPKIHLNVNLTVFSVSIKMGGLCYIATLVSIGFNIRLINATRTEVSIHFKIVMTLKSLKVIESGTIR